MSWRRTGLASKCGELLPWFEDGRLLLCKWATLTGVGASVHFGCLFGLGSFSATAQNLACASAQTGNYETEGWTGRPVHDGSMSGLSTIKKRIMIIESPSIVMSGHQCQCDIFKSLKL